MEASEKGLLDIVQMVVEHPETTEIELNAKSWSMTAFEAACYYGQLEIVKLFLSYSSTKPIELDTRAQLAFKYACISGQSNKDVVKLLLDNFKSKLMSNDLLNMFRYACTIGSSDIVRLFLEYPGLDIDYNTPITLDGVTIFMAICDCASIGHRDKQKSLDVIKVLMEYSSIKNITVPNCDLYSQEVKDIIKNNK